ncbi:MAG: hypothetical protein KGJ86_03165 [Chloroflexota bacterium]|nr:hypothetical protein [Chloroflexota bacterium]
MSKEAVNQIIERAVQDEAFFERLRTDPAGATAGFELDEAERQAFAVGAYNVVVRSTRREREEKTRQAAQPPTEVVPATSLPQPEQPGEPPAPGRAATAAAGAILGLVVVLGGTGAFRYVERQWPWEALGLAKAASPASIPSPTLGARPTSKPAPAGAAAASPSASPSAAPSASPSAVPSASPSVPSPSAPAASGQAQLRSTPAASPSSPGEGVAVQRAYYEQVSQGLQAALKGFGATLTAIRDGKDATQPLSAFSASLADLQRQLPGAVPPDSLKQQHQALQQAVPLMVSDVDQLKGALNQKNQVQAVLIASEIDALFRELQDEVAFASAPHPDFYQAIETKQVLRHVVNFDVVSQSITQQGNSPASVQIRVALRSANPTQDEVTDTLHHGVVVARQGYPQATQVKVVGYKEASGSVGPQVGSADWYCGPNNLPGGVSSSAKWQDYCGKIYVTSPPGSKASEVPY